LISLIYIQPDMATKGGIRPGAGRPKGRKNDATLVAEEAREMLKKMVFEELEPIARGLLDSAKGLSYQGEDGLVYTLKPDKGAADLLLMHTLGKPKQAVEIEERHTILIDI
jgi:hypothetical protein